MLFARSRLASKWAFLALMAALFGGPAVAQSKDARGEKMMVSAAAFLHQYEKRDKACDPALITMYDDNARIESEIERKGEPLIKKTYSKEEYKAMIAAAFASPEGAKASAETSYETPKIKAEAGGNECRLEFTATHGDSAMRVTWHLRQSEDGTIKILKEQSLTYRHSLGATKKSPLEKPLEK